MTLDDINAINRQMNQLPYKAEATDDWYPIDLTGGDCDSYATGKFEALVAAGCPVMALRLALCYVESGEYHCVLLVDWEGQTYVLDNRFTDAARFNDIPFKYTWHQFQIAGTQKWEAA